MARFFATQFYDSKQWHKSRASYIAKRRAIDGGMCEDCKEKPGVIVHHKIWLNEENINNPDIAINHANFKYVCIECHNTVEHGYQRKKIQDEIEYEFDSNGNPVPKGR